MTKTLINTWPAHQLGDALAHLVKLEFGLTSTQPSPAGSLDLYLENAAARLGLECVPMPIEYAAGEQFDLAGPAILQTADGTFAVLLSSGRLLAPDLKTHARKGLHAALFAPAQEKVAPKVDELLTAAGLTGYRRSQARQALLRDLLVGTMPVTCWQLRQRPGHSAWSIARAAGLPGQLAALVGTYSLQYAFVLGAWWLIGQAALAGRVDPAWLVAWALLLFTAVPLRALITWLQGRIAIVTGGLLKERLLAGVMRLEPEETRHQGVGQFFGRVVESDALESLALSGGLLSLVALVEVVAVVAVAALGAGGFLHSALFAAWVLLTGWAAQRYLASFRRWTAGRLDMTAELIEGMVGHRTRTAQQRPGVWHVGEDRTLSAYVETSGAMDRAAARLAALVPRGWLILSILVLSAAFTGATGPANTASLAVGIGGMLLGFRALKRLATGLRYLAGAWIAWEQIRPLFAAAERTAPAGSPALSLDTRPREAGSPLLEASDVVFRYPERAEPVLRGCSLRIVHGSRLILEGRSGGGKSTLASLIAGLRAPTSGLLSLAGWDRSTLGAAGWRRLVSLAPQFHENHVLTGTFLYNALLGRPGITRRRDVMEAEEVCRELGLGPLLDRMPSGLLQLVGETGWQLSHGERSRLFIARVLLQGADLVVLDESFAALDPETLRQALDCVQRRAGAVLAIAHE